MEKIKVHVVSHSHWDREWYVHHEQYHMRLIDLLDDVLEQIENNHQFNSFHLDGQLIIIDDYLKVKPENKDRIMNAITSKKLKIGPWYVAQDCYLTSSEANYRNLEIGLSESEKFGITDHIGYFPDTFGFPLQTVQLYKRHGIETLIFGRGVSVNPKGQTNGSESKYTEVVLEAPNGDQILGIILGNWYNNGAEIPTVKEDAIKYWDKKISEAKSYASTRHLLMMNGSDHQPLQKDVIQAINLANELYPEIEFVHTSIESYVNEIKAEIDTSKLTVLSGEIRQQYTDSMYYLTATASSRVETKIQNFKTQEFVEQSVEPLMSMYNVYQPEKLQYLWKKLLANNAHDSICGCSCDEVNNSVLERFVACNNIGKYLVDKCQHIIRQTHKGGTNSFVITNPLLTTQPKYYEFIFDGFKQIFTDKTYSEVKETVENNKLESFVLVDNDGNVIDAVIENLGIGTGYNIPENKFRESYFCNKLKIKFVDNVPSMTSKVYEVKSKSDYRNRSAIKGQKKISNTKYEIWFDEKLNIKKLDSNLTIENFLRFVDDGDIGNTFMYCPAIDNRQISLEFNECYVTQFVNYEEMILSGKTYLPESAESKINEERNSFVYCENRESKRSNMLREVEYKLKIRLLKESEIIDFNFEIDNKISDHRIRAVFASSFEFDTITAGGMYQQIEREARLSYKEKLANNQAIYEKVISVSDHQYGMTVGTQGLYEYESESEKELSITLLRSVGEMGDWLYFSTPDAQCLGQQELKFNISYYPLEEKVKILRNHYNFYTEQIITELPSNIFRRLELNQKLDLKSDDLIVTAILPCVDNNYSRVRGYALKDTSIPNEMMCISAITGGTLERKITLNENEIFDWYVRKGSV